METAIGIVCNQTNIENTLKIWCKKKGWIFRHKVETDRSIIEIFHFDTMLAKIFWYYGGVTEEDKIYLIIEKLEQGYSLTDRRFIKALISDNNYTSFKQWAGNVKRYRNTY